MRSKLISFFIALGLTKAVYKSNHSLEISFYRVKTNKIKETFRVVHLSDTHIPYSGFKLHRLVKEIRELEPDLIVLTGDILDRMADEKAVDRAHWFFDELDKIAQVVTVSGNHDYFKRNQLKHPLNDEELILGNGIRVIGLNPYYNNELSINPNELTLVLKHYPWPLKMAEDSYQFSGHVHGGQFRFKNRGFVGPDQGFFPKYTKGYYPLGKNRGMFLSAGLGASQIPLRLNNPNHVIVVDFVV